MDVSAMAESKLNGCLSNGCMDMPITDAHRRDYYVQMLESFAVFNKHFPETGYLGALIGMAAGMGRIDGTYYNASSLAQMLGLSKATVWRKAKELERSGFVHLVEDGKRTSIHSNMEDLLAQGDRDEFCDLVDQMLLAGRKRLKEPAAISDESL